MKAILVFHAPNLGSILHPFLIKEIKMLSECADEVHLVCQRSKCGYDELRQFNNLIIHDYSAKQIRCHMVAAIPLYFTSYAFMEYKEVCKRRQLGKSYIIDCIRLITVGDYIYKKLKRIIEKDKDEENWVVDSYWFSNSAYAVARLKKKFPKIYSFTRAHSFEIDPIKNKFYYAGAKHYVQKYIDEILFISDKGRQFYFDNIINSYPKVSDSIGEKCKVFRLGTLKRNNNLSSISRDGKIHMVSCSRIDIEKRVELIAEALAEWKGTPIEWTHFGGGNTAKIEAILKNVDDQKVSVRIMGYCLNEEVHRYYSENSIDVFINVSSSEGVPVSIMEAQSYGIPVIATNVGGVSEIVNKENGVLLSATPSTNEIIDAINSFDPTTNEIENLLKKRKLSYLNWENRYSELKNDTLLKKHIGNMLQGIKK